MIAIATRNAMGFCAVDHLLPDDVLLLLGINLVGISVIFILGFYSLCRFARLLWQLRGNQMPFFIFGLVMRGQLIIQFEESFQCSCVQALHRRSAVKSKWQPIFLALMIR